MYHRSKPRIFATREQKQIADAKRRAGLTPEQLEARHAPLHQPKYVVMIDREKCPVATDRDIMLLTLEDLAVLQSEVLADDKLQRDLLDPMDGITLFGLTTDNETVHIFADNDDSRSAAAWAKVDAMINSCGKSGYFEILAAQKDAKQITRREAIAEQYLVTSATCKLLPLLRYGTVTA